MADDTTLIQTKGLTFFDAIRLMWWLSVMHLKVWAGLMAAVWRGGATVSLKVTPQESGRSVTVTVEN